jgi:hypothetical protein
MKKLKVISVSNDGICFEEGYSLSSDHSQDCCESHSLDFSNTGLEEFQDLEFDLSSDDFFEKVENYGIRLKPLNGHPISVPGYGYNNGYYSTNLELVVTGPNYNKTYDITECQEIRD